MEPISNWYNQVQAQDDVKKQIQMAHNKVTLKGFRLVPEFE